MRLDMDKIDTTIEKVSDTLTRCSFVIACSKYFGRKDHQTLKEFNDELKALTPADRTEFKQMFKAAGYDIMDI